MYCLIPPARYDENEITGELLHAAKKANISNVCMISSIDCDCAVPKKQPHIREFIELESLTGFYAENLLLYAPQAQSEGVLPLPIGENHKFAPVALGARNPILSNNELKRHAITSSVYRMTSKWRSTRREHGFDDTHRVQLMVIRGPMLCAGVELATAASQALGYVSDSFCRKWHDRGDWGFQTQRYKTVG
ncbi:hypothetical protein PG995_006448 [Apiospora arundinis]